MVLFAKTSGSDYMMGTTSDTYNKVVFILKDKIFYSILKYFHSYGQIIPELFYFKQ